MKKVWRNICLFADSSLSQFYHSKQSITNLCYPTRIQSSQPTLMVFGISYRYGSRMYLPYVYVLHEDSVSSHNIKLFYRVHRICGEMTMTIGVRSSYMATYLANSIIIATLRYIKYHTSYTCLSKLGDIGTRVVHGYIQNNTL
jgi:hypothetical protein